jgi:hypothetical protein
MIFIDLYRYAETLEYDYVPFDALSNEVVTKHERVGSLELYPCDLNENFSLGHTILIPGVLSQDGQMLAAVQIRYARGMQDYAEKRFVWTKELMHVFDSQEAAVDTPEKLLTLLLELESRPMHVDASAMLVSEDDAEWMAVLVLCPLRLRNRYKRDMDEGRATLAQIAESLQIPEWVARDAMSPYYETAIRRLAGIAVTSTRRRQG